MQRGNSRPVLVPGQVQLGCQHIETPAAHPSSLNLPVDGGLRTIVYGGLTKREYAMVHIAASLSQNGLSPIAIAAHAADLAEALFPFPSPAPQDAQQDNQEHDAHGAPPPKSPIITG